MPRLSYNSGDAVEVPFADFAPDLDPAAKGILLDMNGAVPVVMGFQARPSPEQIGPAPTLLPGGTDGVRGSSQAFYSQGTLLTRLIAGTTSHLWAYNYTDGSTPPLVATEIDSGQTFLLSSTSRWRFFQFGDDVIALAQGFTDGNAGILPQVAHGFTGQFSPLPGTFFDSPPLMTWAPLTPFAAGDVVRDSNSNYQIVVTAGTSGAGPGQPTWSTSSGGFTVDGSVTWQLTLFDLTDCTTGCASAGFAFLFKGQQWFSSAAGVDDNWTPNVQTLAATGFLYDYPGPIVACAPFYRTVIAFKEQAMWVGSFVGPPNSWQWQLISDFTGTRAQEAVVVLPDAVAFLGTDDFYITTGSVPIRIPNNVKEWFFDNAVELPSVIGWYDVSHSVIYWHFISRTAPFVGIPDSFVAYNTRSKRWAKGTVSLRSVPSPATSPGATIPTYFDVTSTLQRLSGTPGVMTLTTGWTGDAAALTQLLRVRAKYRTYPTTQRLVGYHVNALGKIPPAVPGPAAFLGFDDWFNLRQTGRYHQVVLSTSGACEVTALDYEGRTAGVR